MIVSGFWQEGCTSRAMCATCGRWIIDERAWHYWVGLVCKHTVCASCSEAS